MNDCEETIMEGEGVPTFVVVGWFDGTSHAKFCLNFADAMNTMEEYRNKHPYKRNWFLELNMMMRVDYENEKGKMTFKYISETNLVKEGTYDLYCKESDRVADEKLRDITGSDNSGK